MTSSCACGLFLRRCEMFLIVNLSNVQLAPLYACTWPVDWNTRGALKCHLILNLVYLFRNYQQNICIFKCTSEFCYSSLFKINANLKKKNQVLSAPFHGALFILFVDFSPFSNFICCSVCSLNTWNSLVTRKTRMK